MLSAVLQHESISQVYDRSRFRTTSGNLFADDQMSTDSVKLVSTVGNEVPTPVVMNTPVFWDKMSCSPLKVNPCFVGTHGLRLKSQRINIAINQREVGSKQFKNISGI
jgi:hypothetical protein